MTDQLDELHARAGLDLLEADAALTVYEGGVPSPTPDPPYVVVYTIVTWPSALEGGANALDHRSVTCHVSWLCHCVGLTAAAARAVGMRVRAALLNQRPTIAGRSCGLIQQDDAQPPTRDESTGRLVIDVMSTYSLYTAPG